MRLSWWRHAGIILTALVLPPSTVKARLIEDIKASGQLIACANPDALPVSARGEREGFQLEIAREIAAALDVSLYVEWIWARYQVKFTDCDLLLGVARNPKPGEGMRYSQALTDVEILLAFRADAPIVETPEAVRPLTKDDLAGKIIAAPSASLAQLRLQELGANIRVAYRSDEAILNALAAGEIDGGIVTNLSLTWYETVDPSASLDGLSAARLDLPAGYPMALGLRGSDSLSQADIEDILAALRDSGRLQAILGGYGQSLSVAFDDPDARIARELVPPEGNGLPRGVMERLRKIMEK